MPTLVITDETAAHTAISYDPSRNLGIGGTATDRLTTNGSPVATTGAVADASTVDSSSISPVTGSVAVAAGNVASVTSSVSTRFPDVQTWYSILTAPFGAPTFQIYALSNGSFTLI